MVLTEQLSMKLKFLTKANQFYWRPRSSLRCRAPPSQEIPDLSLRERNNATRSQVVCQQNQQNFFIYYCGIGQPIWGNFSLTKWILSSEVMVAQFGRWSECRRPPTPRNKLFHLPPSLFLFFSSSTLLDPFFLLHPLAPASIFCLPIHYSPYPLLSSSILSFGCHWLTRVHCACYC